jgi:pyruvate dehydrogenase complex dehydrogenase (E1) component
MYTELKDRGLGLIAINGLDDKKTVLDFIKEHKLSFPVALGADSSGQGGEVTKLYEAYAFPTNYILDSSGKIVWSSNEFDEAQVRTLLKRLGVQ